MACAALLGHPVQPVAGEIIPWQALFQSVAGARWVDRAAQVQAESRFDPDALSPVGAAGVSQWMPESWRDAIKNGWAPPGSSPRDPYAAIPAQHAYMNWLEVYCKGFEPGLAGYNAGPGSIRKAQTLAKALGLPGDRAWLVALEKVTGVVHATETRGYLINNARNRASIWKKVKP